MDPRTIAAFFVTAALASTAHSSGLLRTGAVSPPAISVTRTLRPSAFPHEIIVGRSRCGEVTWLLTAALDLIDVATESTAVTARKVTGLARDDRPWGLACLDDRSVWTLANPRALVRLAGDGQAHERIPLILPRAALFAAGDRVLFQQLPIVIGTDALVTSPPRDPAAARAWPGLVQRARASRAEEVLHNLVDCGLAVAGSLPCWFADELRIVVSNGRVTRTVDAGRLASRRTIAAIHDVALAPHGLWLLARDREASGAAAAVLLFADDLSGAASVVDLKPAARLLLAASDTNCLLLTTDGQFAEVRVTR